jgi:hypothetical protein
MKFRHKLGMSSAVHGSTLDTRHSLYLEIGSYSGNGSRSSAELNPKLNVRNGWKADVERRAIAY